jgi:hypothetical protein
MQANAAHPLDGAAAASPRPDWFTPHLLFPLSFPSSSLSDRNFDFSRPCMCGDEPWGAPNTSVSGASAGSRVGLQSPLKLAQNVLWMQLGISEALCKLEPHHYAFSRQVEMGEEQAPQLLQHVLVHGRLGHVFAPHASAR